MTPRDLLHRRTGLLLPQDPDDLLFRKSTLHQKVLLLITRQPQAYEGLA